MPSSVLVVGDGDKMQQSVALNLKRRGYQHIVAETGQAALDLARQHFFDVAFVDTHLSDTQWMDLPRCQEPVKSEIPTQVRHDMPRGSEMILLAEDDEAVRELARRILEGQGYTLLVAEDGAAALPLAADRYDAIHLLVTDVVMPGISGRLLAEGLSKICPGLKTLYMSGYTDQAIGQQKILAAGAAFLQMPFSPLALASKVRQVLDDSHSEDLDGTGPSDPPV